MVVVVVAVVAGGVLKAVFLLVSHTDVLRG